jgi:toxin CptA
MSIAVSAVVKPSRILLAAIGGMCVGAVVVAGMVGLGQIGKLSTLPRLFIAGSCGLAAFFAFYSAVQSRKTFRIDISDIGQIRLEEYIGAEKFSSATGAAKNNVVELMPDSTIWPHLLLLRLRSDDNQITVLPILRDCVGVGIFRALSIAFRWIATQNSRAENTQN